MKYWFLKIGIRNGEYEFNSISVHKTPKKEEFDSDDYVRGFYGGGDAEDGMSEDTYNTGDYYFHGGCIACWVQNIKEITLKEYNVLSKLVYT